MRNITAEDIYDKALRIVNDALDGHPVNYDARATAVDLLRVTMSSIQSKREAWEDVIGDDDQPKKEADMPDKPEE